MHTRADSIIIIEVIPTPKKSGAMNTVCFAPKAGISNGTMHARNTISSVTGACVWYGMYLDNIAAMCTHCDIIPEVN